MTDDGTDRSRLGRAIGARYALPKGHRVVGRAPMLGRLAASAVRFAAETALPFDVRRSLHAPRVTTPADAVDEVAPPRWWLPGSADHAPTARPAAAAAHRVPGRMATSLAGRTAAVPSLPEVRAAGPMLTSTEVRRSTPQPPGAASARPTAPTAPAPAPAAPVASAPLRRARGSGLQPVAQWRADRAAAATAVPAPSVVRTPAVRRWRRPGPAGAPHPAGSAPAVASPAALTALTATDVAATAKAGPPAPDAVTMIGTSPSLPVLDAPSGAKAEAATGIGASPSLPVVDAPSTSAAPETPLRRATRPLDHARPSPTDTPPPPARAGAPGSPDSREGDAVPPSAAHARAAAALPSALAAGHPPTAAQGSTGVPALPLDGILARRQAQVSARVVRTVGARRAGSAAAPSAAGSSSEKPSSARPSAPAAPPPTSGPTATSDRAPDVASAPEAAVRRVPAQRAPATPAAAQPPPATMPAGDAARSAGALAPGPSAETQPVAHEQPSIAEPARSAAADATSAGDARPPFALRRAVAPLHVSGALPAVASPPAARAPGTAASTAGASAAPAPTSALLRRALTTFASHDLPASHPAGAHPPVARRLRRATTTASQGTAASTARPGSPGSAAAPSSLQVARRAGPTLPGALTAPLPVHARELPVLRRSTSPAGFAAATVPTRSFTAPDAVPQPPVTAGTGHWAAAAPTPSPAVTAKGPDAAPLPQDVVARRTVATATARSSRLGVARVMAAPREVDDPAGRVLHTPAGGRPSAAPPLPRPAVVRRSLAVPAIPADVEVPMAATASSATHDGAPVRRSLLETAGPLFAARAAAGDSAVVRRRQSAHTEGVHKEQGDSGEAPTDEHTEMDDLVDRLVERLERRVIDELERRGRRSYPGGF